MTGIGIPPGLKPSGSEGSTPSLPTIFILHGFGFEESHTIAVSFDKQKLEELAKRANEYHPTQPEYRIPDDDDSAEWDRILAEEKKWEDAHPLAPFSICPIAVLSRFAKFSVHEYPIT